MSEPTPSKPPVLPVTNYAPAIAKAIAWLGERHLLATPVHALSAPSRPHPRAH